MNTYAKYGKVSENIALLINRAISLNSLARFHQANVFPLAVFDWEMPNGWNFL